jgi:hypothetical protein
MEVDVTEIVREAARVNEDHKLSIGILRLDDLGAFNLIFNSKEASTASYRPCLVYAMGRPVAPRFAQNQRVCDGELVALPRGVGLCRPPRGGHEGVYTVLSNPGHGVQGCDGGAAETTYFYTLAAVTGGGRDRGLLAASACVPGVEYRYPVGGHVHRVERRFDDDHDARERHDAGVKRSPIRERLVQIRRGGAGKIFPAPVSACARPRRTADIHGKHRFPERRFRRLNEYGATYANPPRGTRPKRVHGGQGEQRVGQSYCPYKDPKHQYDNYMEADVTEAVRQAARDGKTYITLFLTGDDTLMWTRGCRTCWRAEYGHPAQRRC